MKNSRKHLDSMGGNLNSYPCWITKLHYHPLTSSNSNLKERKIKVDYFYQKSINHTTFKIYFFVRLHVSCFTVLFQTIIFSLSYTYYTIQFNIKSWHLKYPGTGWPSKHGRVFLVPFKIVLSSVRFCTREQVTFYKEHMAMLNWPPCITNKNDSFFLTNSSVFTREAAKKLLCLVGLPLRTLAPPPAPLGLVAIGTFFLTLKKSSFFHTRFALPPLSGRATKKRPFLRVPLTIIPSVNWRNHLNPLYNIYISSL